jgi:hypothetical protein
MFLLKNKFSVTNVELSITESGNKNIVNASTEDMI